MRFSFRAGSTGQDPFATEPFRPSLAGAHSWRRDCLTGVIARDTTWSGDTVRVAGDILVPEGVTLTIDPGCVVQFQGYGGIEVQGRLLAVGEPGDPIRFRSRDPEAFEPDSSTTGAWSGICFPRPPASAQSRLEWCEIAYAKGLDGFGLGGALHLEGFSNLVVRNCVFHHNLAQYGGVLYCSHNSSPRISGCVMTANYALTGGSAIYALDSYPRIDATTIADNAVLNEGTAYDTGAIHNQMSKTEVWSSILWGNTSSYFGQVQMREPKSRYVTFSDIEGGFKGAGNLDVTPRFLGAGEHPYDLAADSPCVGAGDPDTTGRCLPMFDPAGRPRIAQERIDAGAYEWTDPSNVAWGQDEGGPGDHRGHADARLAVRPNPAARTVAIFFRLERPSSLTVVISDPSGRMVARPGEGWYAAGAHTLLWDGRDRSGRPVPAGMYFVVVRRPGGPVARQHVVVVR